MRHENSDRGLALPVVLALGTVMVLLVGTALGVVVSGLKQASTDQDYVGALDAAYAGVGDYMARLNLNPLYVLDGNPADTKFGAGGARTTDSTNKAFTITAGGAWATVPGSDPKHPAKYRYEVDNSQYTASGVVHLRASGMVGTTVRTVVANIEVDGFFKYVYFTDLETQDPAISGHAKTCALYAWAGRATSCGSVQFGAADKIQGPLRSNDTIVSCSAEFDGTVFSASTATPLVQRATGCASSGTFNAGVKQAGVLAMPESNALMKTEAAQAGCLYTGPTTITYNAGGTMTVVSPWTKFTRVNGSVHSNPALCGSLDALHSTGAVVPQLVKNLLFVQNVPGDTSDPNGWSTSGPTPSYSVGGKTYTVTCLGADGSTAISGMSGSAGWTFGTASTVLQRRPLANEAPATGWTDHSNAALWSTTAPAYGCTNGDLYMKGVALTQTTAGAGNYVYITGDLTLDDLGKDVLGVVGQNGVLVLNPVQDSGTQDEFGDEVYSPLLSGSDRSIQAAILAVNDTFQVQNYDKGGPRGTLTLTGSIAQKFRGPVGTGNAVSQVSGYAKLYKYDALLQTTAPPDFLAPSSTTFSVSRYASVTPAFTANGSQL